MLYASPQTEVIMDRGRRYRQTPMAGRRRRIRMRPLLVGVLAVCLAVCGISLTAYFIQSSRNRAQQAELAATHQADIAREMTAAGVAVAADTAPEPTPGQTGSGQTGGRSASLSTRFFR